MFDQVGAMYSHIAFGNPVATRGPVYVCIALAGGSCYDHHKRLRMKAAGKSWQASPGESFSYGGSKLPQVVRIFPSVLPQT